MIKYELGLMEQIIISVLSKFVGPVGQSDIFYKCPIKMLMLKSQHKNIHLVDEKNKTQVTIKDNN